MQALPRARRGRTLAALGATTLLLLSTSCSRSKVRVERVERQVQLDADGRVVDSSASSTTFIEDDAGSTTTNKTPKAPPLTEDLATDGTAAVDCGQGARKVELTDGGAGTKLADGTSVQIERVGTARLDDFDGDGLDDLAAAYRCSEGQEQVALSLSFWHASAKQPTLSAVSVAPIERTSTVIIPEATGDRRVGVSVLAPDAQTQDPQGQQTVRQVQAIVDGGRLKLVSDEPPTSVDGVESLPITEFPDRLDLTTAGLGPLRLGTTEGELTEALSLVVSQVQYPAVPPCFGGIERVLQVGPIYFGLAQDKLRAIWVTGPSLTTTERAIALAVAPGPGISVLTVGAAIDASNPPAGLSVLGFGEDWVGLGATKPRSTVSLAAEAETPGAFGRNVSGFGLAERVCLRSDFAGATG